MIKHPTIAALAVSSIFLAPTTHAQHSLEQQRQQQLLYELLRQQREQQYQMEMQRQQQDEYRQRMEMDRRQWQTEMDLQQSRGPYRP